MGQQTELNIEQLVKDYMARFYKSYKIPRHGIEDIEQWCKLNLGREFRDWTLYRGHVKDPYASLSIVDPKWCMIFELKFTDSILGTIDTSPNR